jgi:hypothetical protein
MKVSLQFDRHAVALAAGTESTLEEVLYPNLLSTYDESCAEKRGKLPKDDLRWVIDSLRISNVLHSTEAPLNLLSVSQLCDLGLKVCFDADNCIVRDIRSNEIVLRGRRENNQCV